MSGRLALAVALLATLGVSTAARAEADPAALLAPTTVGEVLADGWRLEHATRATAPAPHLRYTFVHRRWGRFDVALDARDPQGGAYGRTRSFDIYSPARSWGEEARGASCKALLDAVVERVRRNDHGQVTLTAPVRSRRPVGSPEWLTEARWETLSAYEIGLAHVLVALVLLGLLVLLPRVLRDLASLPPGPRWLALAGLAAALALALLIPHRLVQTYHGYDLIEHALTLPGLKRYGPGALVLQHDLLRFIPGEGSAYLWINTILGLLTLPIAAFWLGRLLRDGWVQAVFLVLAAATPLILKDHHSESIFVPTMFCFFLGLALWEEHRRGGGHHLLALAASALTLAVISRPLFIVFVPATLALTEALRDRPAWPPLRRRSVAATTATSALLLVPHVLYLAVFFYVSLVSYRSRGFAAVPGALTIGFLSPGTNLFLTPSYTPLVYPLLWLPAVALAPRARRRAVLGVLAVGWLIFGLLFVDAPEPSRPRLQANAAWFFAAVAAVGAVQLVAWARERSSRRGWAVVVALAALTAVSLIPPARVLWARTNDTEEHAGLLRAAAALPDEPVSVIVLGRGDAPRSWGISRYYPRYLFGPPRRADELLGITTWEAQRRPERRSFFYLGMRCYAKMLGKTPEVARGASGETRAGGPDYVHPRCRDMLTRWRLAPVWEADVPNREKRVRFLWYPPRDTLRLGLYEVLGPAGSPL